MTIFRIVPLLFAAMLLAVSPSAFGQPLPGGVQTVTRDTPRLSPDFMRSAPRELPEMPERWLLRTGVKKGLRGVQLPEEKAVAPDIGVLAAGFFGPWQSLLAEMHEPYVLVRHDAIAGTTGTKPLLIIPSGGLAGTAGSAFFRAGLDAYVREGGTIICFAQRSGTDYDALPAPSGARIQAAGWAEDHGPLLARSSLQAAHPAFSRLERTVPGIETSGHLISVPLDSRVLLARPDGRPTLVLYNHGAGRVIIASLFSDVLRGMGQLHPDERTLLQDLLLWSKAPAGSAAAAPGDRLNFTLPVPNMPAGAALVKILVHASGAAAPVLEQVFPAPSPGLPLSIPFSYVIPQKAPAGIYHLEYAYLDQKGKALAAPVESSEGRFSVSTAPDARPTDPVPLERVAYPGSPRVRAALDTRDGSTVVALELQFASAPRPEAPLRLIVRVANVIKELTVIEQAARVAFELDPRSAAPEIPVTVHLRDGGLLHEEVLPSGPANIGIVSVDRESYLPGETAQIRASGLGRGELSISGIGHSDSDVVEGQDGLPLPIPPGLPAGRYPLSWEFKPVRTDPRSGTSWITVRGTQVTITGFSVTTAPDGDAQKAAARIAISSSHNVSVKIALRLETDSQGAQEYVSETDAVLKAGQQEMLLPFTFRPRQAGLHKLYAAVSAKLPNGPGFPGHPVLIAESDAVFDVGAAALIGIAADRRVSYEPEGEVRVRTYLAGKGPVHLDVNMDGDRLKRKRLDLAGADELTIVLPDAPPGAHMLHALLAGAEPPSSAATTFLYGATLPDLSLTIVTADPASADMEIGLGIRNEGTAAAPGTTAVLYDGDPGSGGRKIGSVDVPPLLPGQTNISLLSWSIVKRTGERTLTALVDPRNRVAERNEQNNRSRQQLFIPDFLLHLSTTRREFGPTETIPFHLKAQNLTSRRRRPMNMTVQLLESTGKALFHETFPMADLPAPGHQELDRVFTPKDALSPGTYVLTAILSDSGGIVANTLQEVVIPPSLDLSGTLQISSDRARQCEPLDLKYSIANTGNIPITSGSAKLELLRQGADEPAFTKDVALVFVPQQERLAWLQAAPGVYSVRLKAWPANEQHRLRKEQLLAEQSLQVIPPVRAENIGRSFPRVLVWLGSGGGARGRAAAEGMLRNGFDRQGIYFQTVHSSDDFVKQALAGMFNTFLLLDVSDPPGDLRWLRDFVAQGNGLVITGPDGASRSAAEAFGFSFGDPLTRSGALLQVSEKASLGISGSFPASGTVLLPKKRGAAALMTASGDGRPVALLDGSLSGKVLLLPFSLTRSVRESGAASLYSVLLRSAVRAAAPANELSADFGAGGLLLTAMDEPVTIRATVTFPENASLVWTEGGGTVKENVLVIEQELDSRTQQFIYLYRTGPGKSLPPVVEVFFRCNGAWVSQGKAE